MAKERKGKPYDFTQKETQAAATNLLENVLLSIKETIPDNSDYKSIKFCVKYINLISFADSNIRDIKNKKLNK